MLSEYFTVKEAADLLGLKPPTVSARIRKGLIKSEKKGWNVFIHIDEIKRLKSDADTTNMGKTTR